MIALTSGDGLDAIFSGGPGSGLRYYDPVNIWSRDCTWECALTYNLILEIPFCSTFDPFRILDPDTDTIV